MGAHDRFLAESAKERPQDTEDHHHECPAGEDENSECFCASLDARDARRRKKKRKEFGSGERK